MDIRQRGIIKSWRDEKGFGFIAPADGGPDVFFHVSSVTNSRRRDLVGQRVTYLPERGKDGRPAAGDVRLAEADDNARPVRARPVRGRSRTGVLLAWTVSLGFLAAVVVYALQHGSTLVPVAYFAICAITYGTYSSDKRNALAGYWRVPESTLHLLELMGGWPGALVAQWTLPHKNRKGAYQVAFWFIVVLHVGIAGLLALHFRGQSLDTGLAKFFDARPPIERGDGESGSVRVEWSR